MSDEGRWEEVSLWPEIWGQESVGVLESIVGSFNEVLKSLGRSSGGGEAIFNTSELQEFLGGGGTNNT